MENKDVHSARNGLAKMEKAISSVAGRWCEQGQSVEFLFQLLSEIFLYWRSLVKMKKTIYLRLR
jgi:hypothetical protein